MLFHYLPLQIQVYLPESGLLRHVEKVAIVEVEHGGLRSEGLLGGCLYLVRKIPDLCDIHAKQLIRRPWVHQAIDRFQDRDSPSRLEYAIELRQRTLLVGDINEHRPSCHNINGRVLDCTKVVSPGNNELTPLCDVKLVRQLTATVEQIPGDITKDHTTAITDQFHRPEGNQTITGPNVEQDITRTSPRFIQDTRSKALELREHPLSQVRVSAVTSLEEPLRPTITDLAFVMDGLLAHRSNLSRLSGFAEAVRTYSWRSRLAPTELSDFGSRYGKTRPDDYFARGVAKWVAVNSAKPAKDSDAWTPIDQVRPLNSLLDKLKAEGADLSEFAIPAHWAKQPFTAASYDQYVTDALLAPRLEALIVYLRDEVKPRTPTDT